MSGYDVVYPDIGTQVITWLRSLPDEVVVAFDPGPRVMDIPVDKLDEVLARSDWLLCNAHEATSLTGESEMKMAAEGLLARTGRHGVVIRDGAKVAISLSQWRPCCRFARCPPTSLTPMVRAMFTMVYSSLRFRGARTCSRPSSVPTSPRQSRLGNWVPRRALGATSSVRRGRARISAVCLT